MSKPRDFEGSDLRTRIEALFEKLSNEAVVV
jgi:hypothetical protein